MPGGIELPASLHRHAGEALLEDADLLQRLLELALRPDDADERLHTLLQVGVDGVGVLPALASEGREQLGDGRLGLATIRGDRGREALHVLRGRSEERRVGKECRCRDLTYHTK